MSNSNSTNIRSNESAKNARLDASAPRGQGWPGIASTPAEQTINGHVDAPPPLHASQDTNFATALADPVRAFESRAQHATATAQASAAATGRDSERENTGCEAAPPSAARLGRSRDLS